MLSNPVGTRSWYLQTENGAVISIPLPPSTNARMRPVRMGKFCREILTAEARDYIENIGTVLKVLAMNLKIKKVEGYEPMNIWMLLPRTNCDNHNYFKVAFDTMEEAWLCSNDKFIMPNVRGIYHDAQDPQFIFEVETI